MTTLKSGNPEEEEIAVSGKSIGFLQHLYAEEKSRSKAKAEFTFIGKKKTDEVKSQMYSFNSAQFEVDWDFKKFELLKSLESDKAYWLNTHGLHNVSIIQEIGENVGIDRLTIRQILDTTLRPKVEEYEQYLFFSIKSINLTEESSIAIENLSFVLGKNQVLSFQEEVSDHFDHIRNKIENGLGLIRKSSADYLLCQLLDAILDNYLETIDKINGEIAQLEISLLKHPSQVTLLKIETEKRVAGLIKKALGPLREALKILESSDTSFIRKKNKKYYVNLRNTCEAAMEEIGSSLTTLESLTNIYFSALSQKMNETMKVLSMVATIFIPLTFIAGIYGMNFDNMPELRHPFGYFFTLGVMGLLIILMIVFFRWKKWL